MLACEKFKGPRVWHEPGLSGWSGLSGLSGSTK